MRSRHTFVRARTRALGLALARISLSCWIASGSALSARAQEATPPTGPAQIFNRANEQRQKDELEQAEKSGDVGAARHDPAPQPQQEPSAPVTAGDDQHAHAML